MSPQNKNKRLKKHYSLVLHLQHLVHGEHSGTGEVLAVLAHLDGLQPFRHRPEGGAVTATGAGEADGHTVGKNGEIDW